jgi:hypothetical protein
MYKIDQNLSLTIPRVFPKWVDEKKIVKVFHTQNIGLIYRVRIYRVPNEKNGQNKTGKISRYPIYKAVIYFSHWYENDIARNFQKRLFEKNEARIVYDDPWFWTIFKNENIKLSKKAKRVIRVSQQLYFTTLAAEEEIREIKRENLLQTALIEECILALKTQNEQIRCLQEFCMKTGLEIPFWDTNHPPAAEVTSLEAISARTAVAAAEFVLEASPDFEEKEYMNWVKMQETEQTATMVAENALAEFGEKNGYYEIQYDEQQQYNEQQCYENESDYYIIYDEASNCYAYNNSAGCGFIRIPRYDDDEIASQYDTEMENEDRYSSSIYKWENRNNRMGDWY